MHYLLGLAALVLGALIATRRTRPTWFVITTCALVVVGGVLAILSYTRVTDPLGFLPNSIAGWVFVGLALMTMFSAIFVLERRGPDGEELPPLIGDNPFDGDTDDSDDPAPGTAPAHAHAAGASSGAHAAEAASQGEAADRHGVAADRHGTPSGVAAVTGAAAAATAAGAAAAGSPGSATIGISGTEAFAQEAAGERARAEGEGAAELEADAAADHHANAGSVAAASPKEEAMTTNDPGQRPGAAPTDDGSLPGNPAMETGLRASLGAGGGDPGAHTDERPAEQDEDRSPASDPGPGSDASGTQDAEFGEPR